MIPTSLRSSFYKFDIVDNQFDPCAKLSWVTLDGTSGVMDGGSLSGDISSQTVMFFSKDKFLTIVLYKLGDAFAASLSTSFLLRGVGFSQAEIGAINKGLGLLATIIGALLGGAWLSSRSLYQSLMLFGILQAFSNVGYWLLSVLPKSYLLMAGAIGIENLCGGLGTAAFVAFLMTLTNPSKIGRASCRERV